MTGSRDEKDVSQSARNRRPGRELPAEDGQAAPAEGCGEIDEGGSANVERTGRGLPGVEMHAQRLQTLGMLAGGIAHDFNNILTGILGHVAYLQSVLPPSGSHAESVAAIEEGARKASIITAQILNFSKLDTSAQPVPVNLCQLMSATFVLLRGAISPRYQLSLSIPEEPLFVRCVEARVAQVIINLAVNARDALSADGRIDISLQRVEDKTNDRELARIVVRDNGVGMSDEVQQRAFEPYFTTKGSSGTGLGLSLVREVIQSFDGAISIESTLGRGTAVAVELPTARASEVETAENSSRGVVKEIFQELSGNERILIVDDEDPVRNVLSLSLEHLGYDVVSAESGPSALKYFEEAGGTFDLVILDMLMPNMSGDQLFDRLRRLKPSLAVLVMSGYSSEEAVRRILRAGGKGFLQKPFTIDELAREVRRCLDGE